MKNEHKKPFVGDFLEFAIRSTAMGNSKTSDLRPKSQRAVVSDLTASNQGANTLEAKNEGNERDPPLLYDWNYPASHNSALLTLSAVFKSTPFFLLFPGFEFGPRSCE